MVKIKLLFLGFVFSALFFYIYEIDAFAQLLSLPLIIIITKNLFELNTFQKPNLFSKYILIVIYCSCFFIIYPEGATVLLLPIGLYVLYLIIVNKKYLIFEQNIFIYYFNASILCIYIATL